MPRCPLLSTESAIRGVAIASLISDCHQTAVHALHTKHMEISLLPTPYSLLPTPYFQAIYTSRCS